ncbi:Hypothetical protein SMAX5B_015346 [Scophthalmus maximus]|uniref:Uncharacterized protein n=1 Tax=Scophthalmus maximus TaxID=52904 RepID=A0A2U9C8N5_SCOMX|nr:Hypothetical protein SMAX5B_015346 [Scophthalmus maximus]
MPGTAGLQDYRKPPAHRWRIHTYIHKNPGIPVEARCDTFFNQCLQKRDKGTPSCLIDRRLLFLRHPDNSPAVNDCAHSPGHRSSSQPAAQPATRAKEDDFSSHSNSSPGITIRGI